VGALIKNQASSGDARTQFIISTHHPEILEYGDRYFGVSVQNKTSNIESMDKGETIAFVHAILKEESEKAEKGEAGAARMLAPMQQSSAGALQPSKRAKRAEQAAEEEE
jgi:hypothetical protein